MNELKLSDFKQVLTKYGIPCEFSGGVLWCYSGGNGAVALRRVSSPDFGYFIAICSSLNDKFDVCIGLQQESNRLTVEGSLSDEYYIIRDLLYQQYAIL